MNLDKWLAIIFLLISCAMAGYGLAALTQWMELLSRPRIKFSSASGRSPLRHPGLPPAETGRGPYGQSVTVC